MNKNIIKNLTVIVFVALTVLALTINVSPTFNSPTYNYSVRHSSQLLNYMTVALIRQDQDKQYYKPYCAGVWIDKEYFLTAYHCVSTQFLEGQRTISYGTALDAYTAGTIDVHFYSPRAAKIIHVDVDVDLALLRAEGDIGFHYSAQFNNSSTRIGSTVHVVGHTAGLAYTYAKGYISAVRIVRPFFSDKDVKVLQLDARVHRGNSGGGVFDGDGNLLGISSFLMTERYIPFFIHRDEILAFLGSV